MIGGRRNTAPDCSMPESGQQQGINSAELYREVKGKYGIVHKGRYEDYLLDELILFVDNTFHTILDRSARYIGGISPGDTLL